MTTIQPLETARAENAPEAGGEADAPPLKITVATVTYNAAALIRRTIVSVEEQDYPYVEHLIIDGNSQDTTLAEVHHYQERNSRVAVPHEVVCLSEPDEGLYDAMNKALAMATGDYIVFLNAGDTLPAPDTLRHVAREAESRPAVIYGQTDLVDEAGNYLGPRHLTAPERLSWRSFRKGMLVCHQAFYARTDLARRTPYDLRYRFSADYDWTVRLLRTAAQRKWEVRNSHRLLCHFLAGGLSKQHHRDSLRERFRIMCRHYGVVSTVLHHVYFLFR